MTSKKALLLSLTVLILATLACKYLPPRTPVPEPTLPPEDVIATSVAATIIAGGGEAPTADVPTEEAPIEESTPEPPSLLRVAFVKDGDVWFWEEGSAAAQITALGDVVSVYLSSDGLVAAFIRQYDWNNEEIYAVNTDGINVRPLVTLADFASMLTLKTALTALPYQIAWVPGTHTLAFNTRFTFEGPGLILPDELRLVDADTVTLSILMPPGTAGDFYYSPDGSQIALVNGTMISVVDANGTNRRDLLTFPLIITYSEYTYYPPVFWSPDGSFLRGVIPGEDPLAVPPDPTTVWHLPANGSGASSLLSITTAPFFQEIAALSPDLNKLAYITVITPGAPPIVDLHISNADGSSDVIYVNGGYGFECWSEDNEHFIYTQNGHFPRLGRLGDPPLDLTGITLMVNPNWVDETRFIYLNRLSGSWELWLRELGTPGMLLASTTGHIIRYDFVK